MHNVCMCIQHVRERECVIMGMCTWVIMSGECALDWLLLSYATLGTSLIKLWCLACVEPCRVRVSVLVCAYDIRILIPPFTIIKNFVIQGDRQTLY